MRTMGSIERYLVVGIVVVIGTILTIAIRGAGDFDRHRGEVAQGDGAGASGGAPPAGERAPARGGNDPARALERRGARPAGDAPRGGAPALRNERPAGSDPGPTPGAGSGGRAADAGGAASEVAGGDAPPERDARNPIIEDLLRKQLAASQGDGGGAGLRHGAAGNAAGSDGGDPAGDGAEAPAPVVVADDDEDAARRKPIEPAVARKWTYEVRSGDSLERIARALYGDGREWKAILAANPQLEDQNRIKVGMRLELPKEPTQQRELASATLPGAPSGSAADALANLGLPARSNAPAAAPAAKAPERAPQGGDAFERTTAAAEHTIAKGDTLMSIALQHYGTRSAWRLVYEANADRIADKDHIKVGTVLRLPE